MVQRWTVLLSSRKVLVLEDPRGPIFKSLSLSLKLESLSLSSSLSLKSLTTTLEMEQRGRGEIQVRLMFVSAVRCLYVVLFAWKVERIVSSMTTRQLRSCWTVVRRARRRRRSLWMSTWARSRWPTTPWLRETRFEWWISLSAESVVNPVPCSNNK